VPFVFALDLDAVRHRPRTDGGRSLVVDQQVQRPLGAAIRDVDGQRLVTAAQRADVGHRPVEPDQPQQTVDEPGRLPERQAEQHLFREARLDGGVVPLMAATPASRRGPRLIAGSHQMVGEQRRLSASLQAGQFVVL
jgi:hypothetical protein